MKGKADKLVANRTLSALAVVCLVISAFAGLLFVTDMTPTRAAEGDLIVQSGTYTIENIEQPIDGDVEVRAGGTLIIRDATMSIISNNVSGLRHDITVFAGGKIILDHGTITPYLDQINPWPFLDINVQGNGELVATNNSLLMFPGNITLTTGAFVSLTDTEIMALPDTLVTQYVIGSSGITFDSADDGPAITLTDSTLELYDSSIFDLPEYATDHKSASDLTLNGESTLLAVNSYISVDFGPARLASDWYVHNAIVINGISHAYLYGATFQTYAGALADRAPAIRTSGTSAPPGVPLTRGASDNTAGSLTNLADVDGGTIQVLPTQTLEIDTWDVSGLSDALPVSSATIVATYAVAPAYSGTAHVQWSRQGSSYSDTSIVPANTDPPGTERLYDLPLSTIATVGDVRNLNVRFVNGAGLGLVEFDRIWVMFTVGADAFIYRWLNATIGDEYGVPIPNAQVVANFTGATELQGQQAIYYSPRSVSTTPPVEVLAYMGETALTYSVTKSDGHAAIPYLTDIITNSGSMDSMFVGSYDITGVTGSFRSTEAFSFPAYPAMTHADQSFDVTVSIIGLSAPSPDPSRWLVVPPSLDIRDMTYYHAGDVIVAAGGTLSFTNSVFQLVQSGSYMKTVYVDGTASSPAKLLFQKSRVTSQYPINIVVKGDGILEVVDSVMEGVNIVIEENAHVLFSNVTMDGKITTAWDAWTENVSIRDSDLGQIPELSGSVVAGFTNTSVPAISVTGDAVALIYRWIHVTVLDGAGMPLPGVNVSTRYYIKQSQAGWAMSSAAPDSLGVAKVNSLGTNLTSIGSTFVGNYWVNATYTYAGHPYYADNSSGEREISLSVKPYEEPLGRNATYATMTIPDALCDLSVNQEYTPVWALDEFGNRTTHPRMGQTVSIYGRINNTGVASAYNVTVEFFDDLNKNGIPEIDNNELLGTTSIPVIMAGSSGVASASWIASGPVDPNNHTFLVVADRNNMIHEINDATPATASGILIIKSLPDIRVTAGTPFIPEIKASIDFVIVGSACDLQARIYNDGDNASTLVKVDFFDDGTYVGSYNITTAIAPGGSTWVSVPWNPANPGVLHTIRVLATLMGSYEETSTGNNQDSVQIMVYDHPDLLLSSIETTPAISVPGGETVMVRAQLQNLNAAPFVDPSLVLYITWADGSIAPIIWELSGVSLSLYSGSIEVTQTFTTPTVTARTDVTLVMLVNEGHNPVETGDYANNEQTIVIAVTDVRPDLSIVSSDIYVQRGTTNVTSDTFGRQVNVRALVRDLGGRRVDAFQVEIGVRNAAGYNITIHTEANYNISANATENTLLVTVPWTINLTTPGAYEIWVRLDGPRSIAEPNEDNNFAVAPFNITLLLVDVLITSDFKEYNAGDMMVISATVTYANMDDPVKGLPGVVFWLVDSTGEVVLDSHSSNETTNQDGGIIVLLRIPTSLDTGTYTVRAMILGSAHDSATTIHVSAQVSGGLFPWWVWILIIVAVVGVVAGFTVYTYIYGLGKLVECGECGAFIPAASKRCPKCGVEFEAGTMKCSECGAWIPAESTECPNCGVKFAGETEEEADYLERMRKEYDEMVSKYRELAKPELGKKFSEKAFEAWWKAQPGYITFDDWLAREEEKKKEGPVPCPVCGTLNPKEASVCHKCGTVFGAAKPMAAPPKKGLPPAAQPEEGAVEEAPLTEERGGTQAQQMPPAMAPRMVIRRPIDRKVVPKKIIKTPVGGEERKEGQDEEENQ